jgi:hypothetical protein
LTTRAGQYSLLHKAAPGPITGGGDTIQSPEEG